LDWENSKEVSLFDTKRNRRFSWGSQGKLKKYLERVYGLRIKARGQISETYGVAEAVDYIRQTKDHVSLRLTQELHRIVFKEFEAFAGKFREKAWKW